MQNNVSLCTIVKNSEDVFHKFMNWGLDNFPEINVVVDTTNDDDTMDAVLHYSKNGYAGCGRVNILVHPFDNFSKQWDRAIEMTTKDFCIYMCCDEIIEELPPDGIEKFMNRAKIHVGVLNRYNLQRDPHHYNTIGYPDRQLRVIRMSTGIKMDGKLVDESLGVDRFTPMEVLPWSIIHWGHIRNKKALALKGKDRLPFAKFDDADGGGLEVHGENWFIYRNEEWDKEFYLKELPDHIENQNRKYWL